MVEQYTNIQYKTYIKRSHIKRTIDEKGTLAEKKRENVGLLTKQGGQKDNNKDEDK